MKIKIELDETLQEEEILIRCNSLSDRIRSIQHTLMELSSVGEKLEFTKGDTEYFLSLDEILFFATDEGIVNAHTKDDMFQTKLKLYELEDLLPGCFMRISKSSILNTAKVYSISKNLTSASKVEFKDTYKQVYVSRYYYRQLKEKLEEKRTKQ